MNVLVTGAFGNIGASTIQALLARGYRVRAFDLPTPANRKAANRLNGRVEMCWGDLRNPFDLSAAVENQQAVIHLAFIIPKLSITGQESESRPEWAEAINVGGTRNLIQAMEVQPQPPRLLFASSIHIYGRTQRLPPPRTADEPVHPVEHYARHKLACEQMVRASGLPWTILRLAASLPVAIRLDPGMFDVPLANRIEYVHTRDVGEAFAAAVDCDAALGKTLLIGGGSRCQHTYAEFVRTVLEGMGVGMLPAAAFGQTEFATDWFDSRESQALLGCQHRTMADYVTDMKEKLGWRLPLLAAFRPLVRAWVLSRSPYWRARR